MTTAPALPTLFGPTMISPVSPEASKVVVCETPVFGDEPVVVTQRDADLLWLSAGVLPLLTSGDVKYQHLRTACHWISRIIEPLREREVLLGQADHLLALLAEYLVSRRQAIAAATVTETLSRWAMSVSAVGASREIRAAGNVYRLTAIATTRGVDGLDTYLRRGTVASSHRSIDDVDQTLGAR